MHREAGDRAERWLLTRSERGNPATDVDADGPGEAACSGGNLVRPLVDGVDYFDRLRAELHDTRPGDQVFFAAWQADPGVRLGMAKDCLGPLLTDALDSGVAVYGLFWLPRFGLRPGFVADNRRFIDLLRSHGGAAHFDQRVRLAGCHHQKFLVIRRQDRPETDVAFVGGIDPCPSRCDDADHEGDPHVQRSIAAVYGERPAWHDVHVAVRGPAVVQVERCFRERWAESRRRRHLLRRLPGRRPRLRAMPELPPPRTAPGRCGPHLVQLLRTYPRLVPPYSFAPHGERSIARGYLKALRNAERLVYVEDQFLWSPMVAEVFADALRRRPGLRVVAVLPNRPDKPDRVHVATHSVAHRRALDLLYAAGGDRFVAYELESTANVPIFVHSKVCVVDDVWCCVGSPNLNRRSWTYDSELAVSVIDESPPVGDASPTVAHDLRVRLWGEHLGRTEHDTADLADPERGLDALRESARRLDRWHEGGRHGSRPPGHLRGHPRPEPATGSRLWVKPLARLAVNPDGRPPLRRRFRHRDSR